VDVDGPHGWELASVNRGRVDPQDREVVSGVCWGLRRVRPLVEIRARFGLNIWALDDVQRGARTVDLEPVRRAASAAALFEEHTLYHGCAEEGIPGILSESPYEAVPFGDDLESIMRNVEAAVFTLRENGIQGPYALVLGSEPYRLVTAAGRLSREEAASQVDGA